MDVAYALQQGNVLLNAEPGAGKSTGLPLVLLQSASVTQRIIMLEPRRLAAIGVAERLAAQLNESVGQRVGLRMRGQTSVSNATVLEVVTEGVLTRMLQSDPTLDGIGCIIFDEFHERSLQADFGLALCLDVQRSIRDDLRLLLMSATLDSDGLQAALGNVAQISCSGRQHPVDIHWLGGGKALLAVQVVAAIQRALSDDQGDILVFLPGVAEIEKAARLLEQNKSALGAQVHRLHGQAKRNHQRAATAPATQKLRRIILSTSIAETSITIDGVRVVIDAGLERRSRINSQTGAQQLETVSASQASATQRAGRAGRTAAGICYRLWSEHDHVRRTQSWQPEIFRAELSSLLMEVGIWGVSDVQALPWLDPPPSAAVSRAEALLDTLGIWRDGRLTEHGHKCAVLPVHARLAHMLIWAAEKGVAPLACKLAVVIEAGVRVNRVVDVDVLMQHPLGDVEHRRITQLIRSLNQMVTEPKTNDLQHPPSVGVLLAQAYPDWLAQRRPGSEARYGLACGAGVFMRDEGLIAQQPYLAVASMGGASKEAQIFLAAAVNIDELESWSPSHFAQVKHLAWDDQQERVIAEKRQCIGKLTIASERITHVSDDETAHALLQGIRKRGIDCLPWNEECRQLQARVECMHTLLPEEISEQWPRMDNASLQHDLEGWLLGWLNGVRSLKALTQLNLLNVLQASLNYQQQVQLDKWLPTRYTVPSGSSIKLRYSALEPPVLAVKLQEMFGCTQNPSVAQGQLLLKVELLSPARRPVQVTTDLANFWTNSYPDVKKDMAGRYPKHDWPDNPMQAKPTAYAKTRKQKK